MYSLIFVEDEPFALNQLITLLKWEDFGFELVSYFDNGEDAIDFLSKNHVDLVVTDIKMNSVSGIDISKYCYENCRNTLVVYCSAYQEFIYAVQGMKYSVVDYIEKPLSKKKIIETLENCRKKLDSISKEKTETISDFISIQDYNDICLFIFDLTNGFYKEYESFKLALDSIEHTIIQNQKCISMILQIDNYDDFIQNKWKHKLQNLTYLITNAISSVHNKYIFLATNHDGNKIEIWGFPLDKTSSLDDFDTDIIVNRLEMFLKLDVSIKRNIIYPDIENLFFSLNENKTPLSKKNAVIEDTVKFIENHYKENISTTDAANNVNVSKSYFCNYYKQHTDENFINTLNKYRIKKAIEIIDSGDLTKFSILHTRVGFQSKAHFYKLFKQYTGYSPSEYVNKNK